MKSLRETMIRVCLLLLGLVIAHLGVTMIELGTDPHLSFLHVYCYICRY